MYIDPNTGGMLFQILAVFFGLFSAIILFFSSKIRFFFAKMKRKMRSKDGEEVQNLTVEEKNPPAANE